MVCVVVLCVTAWFVKCYIQRYMFPLVPDDPRVPGYPVLDETLPAGFESPQGMSSDSTHQKGGTRPITHIAYRGSLNRDPVPLVTSQYQN